MDLKDTRKIPVYVIDFTKMYLLGAGKYLLGNSKIRTRKIPLLLLLMTNREH